MITIAGGCYVERCVDPPWDQLFGSGGRAAAALSALDNNVKLTTYIDEKHRPPLEALAAIFGFKVDFTTIVTTPSFSYYHGLSHPRIRPDLHRISQASPLALDDATILRFGMIEGDAVVRGDAVVYDPQNAFNPRPFHENGSSAKRLAVVANYREAKTLAQIKLNDVPTADLGQAILQNHNADVVVIKQGSFGTTVVTATDQKHLSAFRTERVWPIGSGDVFAAIFAHEWGVLELDPFDAALTASLATAYYCESTYLPIPPDLKSRYSLAPVINSGAFPQTNNQIYLAGPFFTMTERWLIEQSRTHLAEQGFKVFSPLHDVGYGTAEKVVPEDIDAIKRSHLLFAILDGLDPGTLFEVGYARALNKPVIAFVQNEAPNNLKMLKGTECEIVNDFASSIYRATWAAMAL